MVLTGEGNDNPLQYSCLENPTDGEAWWATVHGVAKSRTRLSDFTFMVLTDDFTFMVLTDTHHCSENLQQDLLYSTGNYQGFPGGTVVKNIPANAGDPGSPGGVNGNRLQYSCLESTVDRGAWRAIVMGSQRVERN